MNGIVIFFDVVTILLTVWMCIGALRKWKRSERIPFFFIFVFFYVVPIFIDYIYAFPTYTYSARMRGFDISNNDPTTRIIYDFIVLVIQWLLLHTKIKKANPVSIVYENKYNKQMAVFLYVGLFIAPLLVLLFGKDKSILYTFMWRENDLSAYGYLPIAEELSYVGICCSVVLFFWKSEKKRLLRKLISVLFAYMNICIEGKRSITFFFFLVVFVVMLPGIRDRSISTKQRKKIILSLFLLLIIILVVMIVFTINVKMVNRGYNSVESVYTSIRIDIFRDDRVRMAIYSLLNPEKMHILSYPGETLIPATLNFFPLDYIFGFLGIRPISYTAYISAALMERTTVLQSDAFMTPAIFAELISNFHIIGIILMIALTLWFSKMEERYPYPVNVFIYISYILLHMYSISYIAYFLEITFVLCILCRTNISIDLRRLNTRR